MLRQTSLYLETVLNNLDADRTNTIIHSLTSPFVITPANDVLPSKVTNSRIFEESGTSQIATGLANKSTNCAITRLPKPVAKNYSRPPGFEYRQRLSTKFSYRTTSNIYPPNNGTTGNIKLNERRNHKTTKENGNCSREICTNRFLQSALSRPQKRRLISPRYRFKSTKQVHNKRTLPNGKFDVRKTTHKSKRLYGKTRPQRRLSNSGHSPRLSEVPPANLAESNLSVPGSAINSA